MTTGPAFGPDDGDEQRLIRVFLLDDHEIVRRGVADVINAEPDMVVVGEAATTAVVVDAVGDTQPDVAVLDVRLEDGNGIEACREIRSTYPEIACLILTSFADDQAIVDAAVAGAAGYVLKQIKSDELVAAIRKVAAGSQLLDGATVRFRMKRLRESDEGRVLELTDRERRIFELIGEGYSNRQIAEELRLAEKTVKNYVSNLLAKLGVARRTEAAAFAARIEERQRLRHN
jgi:DNA-binding NarL/FixJ family response regulator